MISKDIIDYCLENNKNIKRYDFNKITSRRLDDFLKDEKILSNNDIFNLWCNKFNINHDNINFFDFNKATLNKVSWDFINFYQMIPFDENNKTIKILISDPFEMDKIALIERLFQKKADVYVKESEELNQLINLLSIDDKDQKSDYDKVIKLIDSLIKTSTEYHASDLHFEINDKNVGLLFRIDGDLRKLMTIDLNSYHQLITKIKILSDLDITITNFPQDGHFLYQKGNYKIDVRVSFIPTIDGERLVMRFFNTSEDIVNLDQLGFLDYQLDDVYSATKGGGIIFVTGPTGSGKTTTLYSLIKYLKEEERNIITVEDPIERKIEGITQIPLALMDYPIILKSIVRQDPDVIMLGEIRDQETAKMAVRLAQTGHLIISTIHTNDSIGVINRLENMGIPKYAIVDTIKLIISQRLVRKPCRYCFDKEEHCNYCHHTGYDGRAMIAEVIKFDQKIKDLIMKDNYRNLILEYKNGCFLKDTASYLIKENIVSLSDIIQTGIEVE